jgi:hypothetical protein
VEAIVVSSLEDFVSGASRLGRANPALSVKYVTEHLIAAVGEIDTL